MSYLVMMIEHHNQAIEMTDLVTDRYERDEIERIADRISAAQGPEITTMESWLEENVFAPARENPAHQNFCGLEGDGSHHHEGAITMAEEVMAEGTDRIVLDMANDLIAEQNTEIVRMERIIEGV